MEADLELFKDKMLSLQSHPAAPGSLPAPIFSISLFAVPPTLLTAHLNTNERGLDVELAEGS